MTEDITKETIGLAKNSGRKTCASGLHILNSFEKQLMLYETTKITSTESLQVVINALAW